MATTNNNNNDIVNENQSCWQDSADISVASSNVDFYRIAYDNISDDHKDEKKSAEELNISMDQPIGNDLKTTIYNSEPKNNFQTPMLSPVYMSTTIPLAGHCDQQASLWPKLSSWISVNNKKKNLTLTNHTQIQPPNGKDNPNRHCDSHEIVKAKKPFLYNGAWIALFLLSICLLMLSFSWMLKVNLKMIEVIDVRLARIDDWTQKYIIHNSRSTVSPFYIPGSSSNRHDFISNGAALTHRRPASHHRSLRPLKEQSGTELAEAPQWPTLLPLDVQQHSQRLVPLMMRKFVSPPTAAVASSSNNDSNSPSPISTSSISVIDTYFKDRVDRGTSTPKPHQHKSMNSDELISSFRDVPEVVSIVATTTTTTEAPPLFLHKLLPKYSSLISSLDEYPAHATLWMSYQRNKAYAISNLTQHADYLCGATLISSEWLITAAHCFDRFNYNNGSIIAIMRSFRKSGEVRNDLFPSSDKTSRNDQIDDQINSPVAVDVLYYRKHPGYNPEGFNGYSGSKMIHDIAMVKLGRVLKKQKKHIEWDYRWKMAEEVPFRDAKLKNISPVTLANLTQTFIGQRCFVPTRDIDETERFDVKYMNMYPKIFTDTFSDVSMPVVEKSDCQSKLGTPISTSEVCAGGELGVDACKGNGGSGLYCIDYKTNSLILKGLASWGISCGQRDVPGVYTDISQYRDWIDYIINQ